MKESRMTRPIKLALAFMAVSALTALSPQARAQQQAPDYFIEAMFNTTTAERLSQFCSSVTVNVAHAQSQSEVLINRLVEEGFGDVSELGTLPGLEEGVRARQAAFLEEYSLAGAGPERVCEVAQGEITRGTTLGAYLVLVEGAAQN